jgi:membrane protease YdiL (CAAX protease family)
LSQAPQPAEKGPVVKSLTGTSFLVGLLVILASAYSQYAIPGLNLITGTLVVYGIPILATALIWGKTIISKALNHTYNALKYGLGYFGAFTVLGIITGTLIFLLLQVFDPSAINLLHRPNPVLQVSPEQAWLMTGLSFLLVGPSEEYLFRGFVFGGLLSFFKNKHWLSLALISSILFAGVHPYYALVYGATSLIQFTDLITFGMAMAATYYISGGNIIVPAMIHGAYDATGFIGVATSMNVGAQLREAMILISAIIAVIVFTQRRSRQD